MNPRRRSKEEYLENLWEFAEQGRDNALELQQALGLHYLPGMLEELVAEGLVTHDTDLHRVALTQTGTEQACKIIRAHRIGERLLFDVFGGEFEKGACEFEHTTTAELVDGICTLLGHPRECPHGLPIPEGDCCRAAVKTTPKLVIPLTELMIGQSARVAYINCRDDRRMHRLSGLQLRPGIAIKLHQRYPCYVVECENASIALDEEIAQDVCVWAHAPQAPQPSSLRRMPGRGRRWWRRWRPGRKADDP